MIRVSALRNFPIICGHRRIGLMQGVSLNEAQNQVRALVISCGIRGKRLVFPDDIANLGNGFILISKVNKYAQEYEMSSCRFVRDSTGLLCGRVMDYAIDEKMLTIQAIEIIPGYIGRERRHRIWVYTYMRTSECELGVPACIGNELLRGEGGK